MIPSFARTLIILATVCLPSLVQGVALIESTCLMRLSFPTNGDVSLEAAYQIETVTASYFEALLISATENGLPPDVNPLTIHVDVADRIITATAATVTAAVSLLYEDDSASLEPLQLDTIMTQVLNQVDITAENFPFASGKDPSEVIFAFQAIENASSVLNVRDDDGYSSTGVGLIVATAFLSVMLVIVSSVLLFITGGWNACKGKITNCLFEEVDDEEYEVANKNTYPIQRSEDEEDEESNMTSVAPGSASGILGVTRNMNNPAAGLGVMTPGGDDDDESSMMYGDGMSPVSQYNNPETLGIVSMRKLPQPESPQVRGGLSGMVMQRLARSAGKKK